jgi:hypothetical protein
MAKTRLINTKFWTDSYIQSLDQTSKLLFLYLLTNTHTEICGIYEISLKTIEFETSIDYDRLSKAIHRLSEDGKIFYQFDYVLIKNFAKHQQSNPKIGLGVQRSLEQLPFNIKECFCVVKDQNDRLYIDYNTLSHLNSNLNLNLNSNLNISKDIQTESETIKEIDSLEVLKEEKKSNSVEQKNSSFGNQDINRMLETIQELLHLEDFKETKKLQRQYGLHLVNLKNKLGKEDFAQRFMELAKEEFHLKNMGSLKYVYNQIKGFVPIKKDNSIQSF